MQRGKAHFRTWIGMSLTDGHMGKLENHQHSEEVLFTQTVRAPLAQTCEVSVYLVPSHLTKTQLHNIHNVDTYIKPM